MEILLLLAVVAGLSWAWIFLGRTGLLGGLLAVLLTGTVFGHPFFHLAAGPVPITIDRVLLLLVLLQCIVHRRYGWTSPDPWGAAEWTLLGFIGVVLLSTFTHDWQAHHAQPLAHAVFFYLMPAAVYWIARQAPLSDRSCAWMFACTALLGVYLALTAVAETQSAWALVVPGYIVSPEYAEFLGRARGPLLNPVGNGILLGACLATTTMLWPRVGRAWQLVLLVLVALMLAACYLTLTRSVWMGGLAAVVLILGLALPGSWRTAVLGSVLLGSALVAAVSWDHVVAFKRDKAVTASEMAESAKLRPILAVVAWHMFEDRPLLGFGYGQYLSECRPYLSDRTTDLPLERARPYIQHNVWLGIVTEMGLVGLVPFVLLLGLWTRDAWRLWRSAALPLGARQCGLLWLALLAAYIPNAMLHNVALIPMVNMLLFFVAGIVSGVARRSLYGARERESAGRTFRDDVQLVPS